MNTSELVVDFSKTVEILVRRPVAYLSVFSIIEKVSLLFLLTFNSTKSIMSSISAREEEV